MKTIAWFIILLIILSITFLLSNTLRCVSNQNVEACPDLCLSEPVQCDPNFQSECGQLLNCRSPEPETYLEYLKDFLKNMKIIK